MNTDIFSQTFVNRVIDTLKEECPEGAGKRITRTSLASKLGLQKEFESTLGAMIKYNMLEGWSSFKGVNGGIGRVGEKPTSKSSSSSTLSVPQEFIDRVGEVLSHLVVSGGKPVPCREIAKALGEPGSKTERLVSAALKTEALSELYTSKRGKGGGIFLAADKDKDKKPVVATSSFDDSNSEDSEDDEDMTVVTTFEAESMNGDDLTDEITRALENELTTDPMTDHNVSEAS